MTDWLRHLVTAGGLGGGVVAALAGAVLAQILVWGMGRLEEPPARRRGVRAGLVSALGGAAAVGLWWWEIRLRAQVPGAGPTPDAELIMRCGAHLVLFTLLAAAASIDLRHRVIPDGITVTGVILGLAWMTLLPEALLPVVMETPRSFAAPAQTPDVLGLAGPLRTPAWPTWLEDRPSWTGLLLACGAFTAWWSVGTAAADAATDGADRASALLQPRPAIATVGIVGIVLAWSVGGDHWRAAASGLVGLAVAGGIVWLTRIGGSLALGREALGFGDVTLMAMVGAWLGWQPAVLTCFLGVLIGLVHGLVQLLVHRDRELPFGPSLCLAAAAVVVWWRPLWQRAGPLFQRPTELLAVVMAVILLTAVSLWVWQELRRARASA